MVSAGGGVNKRRTAGRTAPTTTGKPVQRRTDDGARTVAGLVCLAEVAPEPVRWLWQRYLPEAICTLEGDGGVGKTTIVLDIAARLSRGAAMPDDSPGRLSPAPTIFYANEDSLSQVVRPRFDAADGDARYLHCGPIPSLPGALALVEQQVQAIRPSLVVFDPVTTAIAAGLDTHKDHDVRRALEPLAGISVRCGVTFVLLRHLNKDSTKRAQHRGQGSAAFANLARAALHVGPDPRTEGRMVLAVSKLNVSAFPTALAFRLGERVRWEGPVPYSADDVSTGAAAEEFKGEMARAVELIRSFARRHREVASRELGDAAAAMGISRPTLDRAKRRLGVDAVKRGNQWLSVLPPPPADGAMAGDDDHAAEVEE